MMEILLAARNKRLRGSLAPPPSPHNHAHTTPSAMNAFKWVCGTSTRPRRPTATTATEARDFSPQEALPGLPDHVAVTHILRGDIFDDPADLARLPAVSRAMRAAVAETGLRFTKLGEDEAVDLGCLTSLQRRQRGGRLSRQELLCQAAARGGNLEKLKEFRTNGCLWGVMTCPYAASGGHLEMLQWARDNGCPWNHMTCSYAARAGQLEVLRWARANGCPWNKDTCWAAARGGHLEVLQWARANGCPWDRWTCTAAAEGTPRHTAVGVLERLSVGRDYVRVGGSWRATRDTAVGAREWMPVERGDMRKGGAGRAPRGAAVGACERLPMERVDVHECSEGRAPRGAAVGARERVPVRQVDTRVAAEFPHLSK